jgi:RNase P subunit RPR2
MNTDRKRISKGVYLLSSGAFLVRVTDAKGCSDEVSRSAATRKGAESLVAEAAAIRDRGESVSVARCPEELAHPCCPRSYKSIVRPALPSVQSRTRSGPATTMGCRRCGRAHFIPMNRS